MAYGVIREATFNNINNLRFFIEIYKKDYSDHQRSLNWGGMDLN